MFKKFLNSFFAISLLATSSSAAATPVDLQGNQFWFRYKENVRYEAVIEDDLASKTINATFVGGVGLDFIERLPVKPEWEDDNWLVEDGDLPEGVSFDRSTFAFSGTPVEQGTSKATLYGYDNFGHRIARAYVNFDIRTLPENSVRVSLYAHTGKYFSSNIPLPSGVTIERWEVLSAEPDGVDVNGRYVQGTPTESGFFSIINVGYNYAGQAVFAYYGSLLVEDGPVFPLIADDLKEISRSLLAARWINEPVTRAKNSIGNPGSVIYSFERDQSSPWPGSLRPTSDPYNLKLSGWVQNYFEQATVRLKAVDIDGTTGYSNWFKVGSLGPQAICAPLSSGSIGLEGTVGEPFNNTGYRIPTGNDSATKIFSISTGSLPDGLSLGEDSGLITGTPLKEEKADNIRITVNFPGNESSEPVVCGPYSISIGAAQFNLNADGVEDHYRVGSTLDVTLVPTGGLIQPFSLSVEGDQTLPQSVDFNQETGKITGNLTVAGDYAATFKLTNGDGRTRTKTVAFSVHDDVDVGEMADMNVTRMEISASLASTPYEQETLIGQGVFSIENGPLPQDIVLNEVSGIISGGTRLAAGQYGPFKVRLTDTTGQFDETNDFMIIVGERNPLISQETLSPQFRVNLAASHKPFSVSQAPMAEGFYALSYSINPKTLPDGLVFDETSGTISGLPKSKGKIDGYSITIDEQSPDQLSATSEQFSIVIDNPPDIPVVHVPELKANANGVAITSASPVSTLKSIAANLVGGVDAVVFQKASPQIPGLTFDQTTGQLKGTPTSEFAGEIVVEYVDGDLRPGKIIVPVSVYPYPALQSAQTAYELPRLSDAAEANIIVTGNAGFYGGITWEIDPATPLPAGLSMSGGKITGRSSAQVGTVYNIVIKGISNANGLTASYPITIEIVKQAEAEIDVPSESFLISLDKSTGNVTARDQVSLSKFVSGSYSAPLRWRLITAANSEWMLIDPNSGIITGKPPAVGDYSAEVVATDAEDLDITTPSNIVHIRATLSGKPVIDKVTQELTVRIGETFKTETLLADNVVTPIAFKLKGATPDFSIQPTLGEVVGRYVQAGRRGFNIYVEDAHQRTSNDTDVIVEVVPPLNLDASDVQAHARQYDPSQQVELNFDAAQNAIGGLTYTISGDLPGTLYYKIFDRISGLNSYVGYKDGQYLPTVDQRFGESIDEVEARLAHDHLIFDAEKLTLKGIPSKSGLFNAKLNVTDDHSGSYFRMEDETRLANNSASLDFSLVVASANDLLTRNSADQETLSQFTSRPTISTEALNAAYGLPVSWVAITGKLPDGIQHSSGSSSLVYSGYAQAQGTFSNISWKAIDAAGREVTTQPIEFKVGPRQEFAIKSSIPVPRYMTVFDQDAALTITPINAANGKQNWTVTGASALPPGVTYAVNAGSVVFTGKSTVIGTYSGIAVSAVDDLGAVAKFDVSFKVISSEDPIGLTVSNIRTKVGFPVLMTPPFADAELAVTNSYGTLRFYSYDLPTELALNSATGAMDGTINQAQDFTTDIFVTDDTNRVTSQPVSVSVTPRLRLLVPNEFMAAQGKPLTQDIATDYALGTVTYAKGGGDWPSTVSVNPSNGSIVSATGLPNMQDYPGLTIVATDTFGNGFVDTATSNSFTIKADPTQPSIELLGGILPNGTKRTTPYTLDMAESEYSTIKNAIPSDFNWTMEAEMSKGQTLPPGLTISNGIIRGTPSSSGIFTFEVKAAHKTNQLLSSTKVYTLTVDLPPASLTLLNRSITNATVGTTYTASVLDLAELKEIPASQVTWTLTAVGTTQSIPPGLSFNGSNLAGTPTKVGEYEFTVTGKFTNGTDENYSDSRTYKLTVEGNGFSYISAAAYASCAITLKEEAKCWGEGSYGMLGNNEQGLKASPSQVSGLSAGSQTVASTGGRYHNCFLLENGTVQCTGWNNAGQLGVGTTLGGTTVPLPVQGLSDVVDISSSNYSTCALKSDGTVWCWGQNSSGELGDGSTTMRRAPVKVNLTEQATQITVGATHSCAVTTSGNMQCWGANGSGQLGTGATSGVVLSPVNVNIAAIGGTPRKIWAGNAATCVVTANGGVMCWGSNSSGQLGDGTKVSKVTPVISGGLHSGVADVRTYNHTCALLDNGSVKCWGDNGNGQLGNGTGTSSYTGVTPNGMESGVTQISVNWFATCSLKDDGTAWCWGFGTNGQLGDGTFQHRNYPVRVN